ncbi:MAG: hypothetical protein GOU97_03910 [Nanoarchaeota archaeon]|nr:hypothetical protein [Nanoarchaeota archaeon]
MTLRDLYEQNPWIPEFERARREKLIQLSKERTIYSIDELDGTWKNLVRTARVAQSRAYPPFSDYFVGAAVLGSDEELYWGCNREHALFTLTVHAEGAAISHMVSGKDVESLVEKMIQENEMEFTNLEPRDLPKVRRLAVVVPKKKDPSIPVLPCGLCRADISELMESPDIRILSTFPKGDLAMMVSLDELYPHRFDSTFLETFSKEEN